MLIEEEKTGVSTGQEIVKPLSKEEIETFTRETILSDDIFGRLFIYREQMSDIDFLNLQQALLLKAQKLRCMTLFSQKLRLFEKKVDKIENDKQERLREEQLALRRSYLPSWIDEEYKINEVEFIESFLTEDEMDYHCINGTMYSIKGIVDDEKIKQQIQELISPYIKRNLADTTKKLLNALKIKCVSDFPPLDDSKIHVMNGYYDLEKKEFYSLFDFTLNRLNVRYKADYNEPTAWLDFLLDLLPADDIATLQEYMGYCLIPNKKVQKALYIHGNGGEGKSVIASIISSMFGKSYTMINLKDLLESNFALATLENKLVVIDDDAPTSALKDTSRLKTLITNSEPMQVNPKGKTAYNTVIYSKLIVLSNAPIQAMYDHSDGAYRRQIILKTKDRPTDRVDDKFLNDKLLKEKDSIFMWCLEGLERLISRGYHIYESENSKANIEQLKEDSFNVLAYVKDSEYIEFGNMDYDATSVEIYDSYSYWCNVNGYTPVSRRSVLNHMKVYQNTHKTQYSTNIPRGEKKLRGFKGVHLKKKWVGTP